jgi:4-carboxymuconolactone decarboxylase
MDDAERVRRGMTVRREVLGDEHVDQAVAGTTAFTAPFQDFITRYAWGDVWTRPGLSRAERSLVTLAVLAAMQHETELAMHVRAALRNGLTPEQIREVLLQVAVYAGVPAANRAFAVAQRALAEAGAAGDIPSPARPEDCQDPDRLRFCRRAQCCELGSCPLTTHGRPTCERVYLWRPLTRYR